MEAKLVFQFDKITLELPTVLILFILIALCAIYFIRRYALSKRRISMTPYEFEINIGSQKIKYRIERNTKTIQIAYRIYLELMTRKAALPINEKNDSIDEIYTSWYELFRAIRQEIKDVEGEALVNDTENCQELVDLTLDILNKGLRPHLTEYQADYRAWYSNERKADSIKPNREIQPKYPKYEELLTDIKKVNQILALYAEKLYFIIYGKNRIIE